MPNKKPRKPVNILFIILASIIALSAAFTLFKGGAFVYTLLTRNNPPSGDEQRLEALRSDPMYRISYPRATELRRIERGSLGFYGGTERPPTIMYFAGTNDSDDEVIQFFIDKAIEGGWEIFKGPGKLDTAVRIAVTLQKKNVGWLFVNLYNPEDLNRLITDKLPSDHYNTILQVTLDAEQKERPSL